jgi:hypothetical protein
MVDQELAESNANVRVGGFARIWPFEYQRLPDRGYRMAQRASRVVDGRNGVG